MAVTYGFYNSLNKDRVYNAEQISSIFDGVITDGVFASIGDTLATVPGTGMQVVVKTGKCWFNGTWTINDSLLPLDIEVADVSLSRIDAVVVEVNATVAVRKNSIKIIKGAASANPTNPVMKSGESVYQYPIAYVRVDAGVTSITADKISINVGRGTCPFITSILQQTNIGELFNQWEAEFETWFTNIQNQLSGDVAANLQRQITENKNKIDSFLPNDSTRMILGLSEGATPNDAWQAQALGAGKRIVKVAVKWHLDKTPVQHMYITGGTVIPNHTLYTNANGECYIAVDSNAENVEIGLTNSTNANYFINKKTISKTTTEVLFEIHKMTITGSYEDGETFPIRMALPSKIFFKIPEKDGDSETYSTITGNNGTVTITAILVDDSIVSHTTGGTVVLGGNYIDVSDKNIAITLGNDTTVQISYQFESGHREIDSSGSWNFSPRVKRYDAHLIGGGACGMYYVDHSNHIIGYGGGGGSNLLRTNLIPNGTAFRVTIGSGGAIPVSADTGSAGGTTKLSGGGLSGELTAAGGSPGNGDNSINGNGTPGAVGIHLFNDPTCEIVCDSGGRGGRFSYYAEPASSLNCIGGKGGSGHGGKGGDAYFNKNNIVNGSYVTNGENATYYGSGGGGQAVGYLDDLTTHIKFEKFGKPGAGYRGCVAFRWYY